MEMGAFIRSKNVLLAELSEGALIRRNTVCTVYFIHISFQQS
jgi:hypothetical protein